MQSNNIDLNILKELKEQDFFIETLEKAKENLKRIEKNWGLNKEKINNILFKLMKTQFDLHTTCFVLSPELNGGHHLGNFSFIWGHEMGLKNPNYDLVYLVHESLHSYFNSDDLSHAIIENIADIELSKLLDQTNICRYDTHPFLQELHAKILPFWNLYLNHNKSEISKSQQSQNINYDISMFEKYRSQLSKMEINTFISFLQVELKKINFKTHFEISL